MLGKCPYLYFDHFNLVEFGARYVYNRFPDRENRKLILGDACPSAGNCDGHPAGSHSDLMSFDYVYYHTKPYDASITCYWDRNRGAMGFGEALLTDVYDWERNFLFWKIIYQVFPGALIAVNTAIAEHTEAQARAKYGDRAAREVCVKLVRDPGVTWNHHNHAHIGLSGTIDWDQDIASW